MCALVMAIVGRMSTKAKEPVNHACATQRVKWLAMVARTVVLLNHVLEDPWCKMTPWIHGHNLLWVSPLRERTNGCRRLSVGEIRSNSNIQSINALGT